MTRPRALDLFCCAGGASVGLHSAGFDITGVDIVASANYPFKCYQADALTFPLDDFDFIWASPPCQAYSPLNAYNKKLYPDLIAVTRAKLEASGTPYVIENVVQAPLRDPIMLCGSMFSLHLYQHRNFEASFLIVPPKHPKHSERCSRNGYLPSITHPFMTITGGKHSIAWRDRAATEKGVPWMKDIREICEAIPPAYSEYIGRAAMKII